MTVGFVKKNNDADTSDDVAKTIEVHYVTAKRVFDGTSAKIVKMVAAYVALDTARKVVVNRLSK
jgi:hypothetical protein